MLTGKLSLGNPFTPMISLLILLSVCHIILMILVKEFGIGSTNIFYILHLSAWYCVIMVRGVRGNSVSSLTHLVRKHV